MINFKKHIIQNDAIIKDALLQLNDLSLDAILFVVDNEGKLVGSISYKDWRQ